LTIRRDTGGIMTEFFHPMLQKLHHYWDKCRQGREFPSRRDLDPVEFWFALGYVSLIDVLHAPLRFRYRLVGTNLTDNLGYEMTGRMLDELPEPQVRAYLLERYGEVVRRRQPVVEADNPLLDNRLWYHRTLYLPLSSGGQEIDMIMTCRISERPKEVSKARPEPDHPAPASSFERS
jgi:hypothetical protein